MEPFERAHHLVDQETEPDQDGGGQNGTAVLHVGQRGTAPLQTGGAQAHRDPQNRHRGQDLC